MESREKPPRPSTPLSPANQYPSGQPGVTPHLPPPPFSASALARGKGRGAKGQNRRDRWIQGPMAGNRGEEQEGGEDEGEGEKARTTPYSIMRVRKPT